ncbi:MAG: caspase family protein [Microcystaceae cyanobacterium]
MTLNWQSTAKIIGIDYYSRKSGLKSLPAPSKDAEVIASLFEAYGEHQQIFIERIPCEQDNTQQGKSAQRVKSDEVVKQAELEKAITELLTPPDNNPPDTAFFFFSGHGVRKEIDGKVEVYLATSDRRPNKEGREGIPMSWLGEKIEESKVKEVIVWLDCCFSGELFNYCPDNKRYCFVTATTSYNEAFTSYQQGELTTRLKEGLNPQGKTDERVDSHSLCQFLENNQPQYGQRFQYRTSDSPIPLTTLHPRYFSDRCPYISLSYFQEKDAQFFYGRSQLIAKLMKAVQKDKISLIGVLGASGSGKSSLMRAGLLYKLKRGAVIANRVSSNNWHYIPPFNPTDKPLSQLSQSLLSSHFQNWGKEIPIIMMIDQFEECFTMCDEPTRKAFIERLMRLRSAHPNLKIIIAMRDDFRGRLKEFPLFDEAMSKVIVPHLNREEIEEAIVQPAKVVGLEIEERLKQQLINDVEDYPGSLPLLQYALTELWKETWLKNQETVLRLSVYEKLGGIKGTLEKRAEAIYQSLSPDYQKVAKRIFLELTQVGDTFDARRRVKLGDLVNSHHSLAILNDVTSLLANEENRLLIRSDSGTKISQDLIPLVSREEISVDNSPSLNKVGKKSRSEVVIDVVHEALIRNWQRLGDWKQQYQEGMITARRIEQAALQWKEGGDLWQVAGLAVAENYLEEYGELGMLDGIAEEFIRQTRHKVRRNKWIQRGFMGAMLALVALSVSAALNANRQKIEAQKKGVVAQANLVKLQLDNPEHTKQLVLALDNVENNLAFNKTHLIAENYSVLLETVEQTPRQSTFRGHQDYVRSVAFSPDGRYIVSGSDDKTIKVWDRVNGGEAAIHTFRGHQNYVRSVAFSPDGRYIVSGSWDNTIKVWRAAWQDWVAYACGWLRLDPDFALPASGKESEQEQLALDGAVKACMDVGGWQPEEKADFLVRQGLAIARTKKDIEDIKEPIQKFKKAQRFNPELDLRDNEQKVITYVEQRLIAVSRQQAEEGNLKTVKAKLNKLKKLNSDHPELNIPKLRTELMTTIALAYLEEAERLAIIGATKSAQAKFTELEQLIKAEKLDKQDIYREDLAESFVEKGAEIAQLGSIKGTMLLYEQAQKIDPYLEIDAQSWNILCWFGGIYGYAQDVLDACEQAVNKASDEDKTSWQDSRGLVRALTGDRKGAISDFQAFVQDENKDIEYRNTRQKWIEQLKAGDSIDSIFTKEVLEQLKQE